MKRYAEVFQTKDCFGNIIFSQTFAEILAERFPDLREKIIGKLRRAAYEDLPHSEYHWVDDRIGVYADEIIYLLTKEDK